METRPKLRRHRNPITSTGTARYGPRYAMRAEQRAARCRNHRDHRDRHDRFGGLLAPAAAEKQRGSGRPPRFVARRPRHDPRFVATMGRGAVPSRFVSPKTHEKIMARLTRCNADTAR